MSIIKSMRANSCNARKKGFLMMELMLCFVVILVMVTIIMRYQQQGYDRYARARNQLSILTSFLSGSQETASGQMTKRALPVPPLPENIRTFYSSAFIHSMRMQELIIQMPDNSDHQKKYYLIVADTHA